MAQTTLQKIQAANARTSYYKTKAKKLQDEVNRLTNLLDEQTNPATTNTPSKETIMLTKAKIAFRRSKVGNHLIPVEQDIYVVTEGDM